MNDSEKRRYARHILLPEIGEKGQEKLTESKVLVIGAGGLGSAVLSYLAASGIGTLGIIDHDRVELSNLQRQILHETGDIGRAKTDSARNRIEELNPHIKIITYAERFDQQNAVELVKDYDIIVDGSDNFPTRYAVNDACFAAGKTFISAAIQGFSGQLATFKPGHACYRCFVPAPPPEVATCTERGVVGALCGIMGSWQALEVIKELLQIGESLAGKIVMVDGLTGAARTAFLTRDPQCARCAEHHIIKADYA